MIGQTGESKVRRSGTPRLTIVARGSRTPSGTGCLTYGFTLVELLISVTIIGILAGLSLVALQAAQQSARKEATKATIEKISHYVMQRYESYKTRRLPLDNTLGLNPTQAAQYRLDALRDLMRMEMPDRWNDVEKAQYIDAKNLSVRRGTPFPFGQYTPIPRPALSRAYWQRYNQARTKVRAKYGTGTEEGKGDERLDRYASAECLYMIVTMAFPDAREHFNSTEVADADDDGLPEFLDAWGNPIAFLRWAPGFSDTDVQTIVDPGDSAAAIASRQAACVGDPDPFNPRRLPTQTCSISGWRLVPLIYSAGPDGIYDITAGPNKDPDIPSDTYSYNGNPYTIFGSASTAWDMIGTPFDVDNTSVTATDPANGRLDHYDNLHNHRRQGL